MMRHKNKANRNYRNGIYLISDADEFITVIEQLKKEYNQNKKGAINNDKKPKSIK